MANFNKSFNFRNGVQVDNDNFIVNANGLVGVGTTVPKDYLFNVYGDSRFVGLVTASNLYSTQSNIETLSADNVNISGVVTATTFYGSASGLTGIFAIATDGWLVSGGSISTTSSVGIGTTIPAGNLQIGTGVTINSDGNSTYSGIITAYAFSGFGTDITGINASNISTGTLSNDRLPNNINISGLVTAYAFSGFGTDITGINASNISNGTLDNDRLPSDISVSGIITAYAFSGFGTDITGINASNISNGTLDNDRLPSDISVSGIITASTFDGIASTAQGLTGTPNITVANVSASNVNVSGIVTASNVNVSGIVTASNVNVSGIVTALLSLSVGSGSTILSAINTGKVGIGTISPTRELQIYTDGDALLEVTGTNTSQIVIGQQQTPLVGVGDSTAILRFGNDSRTFDIINGDSGDLNLYLHLSPPVSGVTTGAFNWLYGQTLNKLMTLTYEGNLGIGKTDPENKLEVVGISTVTEDSYVGGDSYVSGDLFVTGNINGNISGEIVASRVYATSGISTVYDLNIQNNLEVSSIGIGTTFPISNIDARTSTALFAAVGVGTTTPRALLDVNGPILSGGVGIGTSTTGGDGIVVSESSVILYNNAVITYNSSVSLDGQSTVGVGTSVSRSSVDFSDAGLDLLGGAYRFMLPPRITESEKVGLSTIAGAFIFNITTNKFQGYTGVAWTDFH